MEPVLTEWNWQAKLTFISLGIVMVMFFYALILGWYRDKGRKIRQKKLGLK